MIINKANDSMFENHTAKLTDLGNGNSILEYSNKDGSNVFKIVFVKIYEYFHVQGDLGCASFTWCDSSITWEWLARRSTNVSYFMEKMQSSELGKKMYEYNSEKTINMIYEHMEQVRLDYIESENDLKPLEIWDDEFGDGFWESGFEDEYSAVAYLREHGEQLLLTDDVWEVMGNLGQTVNVRFLLWFDALNRAVTELNKKEV